MTDNLKTSRASILKPVLLMFGAFAFAFISGMFIHELGHYLTNMALGWPEPRIILHPFDMSQNTVCGVYGGTVYGGAPGIKSRPISPPGPLHSARLITCWLPRSSLPFSGRDERQRDCPSCSPGFPLSSLKG